MNYFPHIFLLSDAASVAKEALRGPIRGLKADLPLVLSPSQTQSESDLTPWDERSAFNQIDLWREKRPSFCVGRGRGECIHGDDVGLPISCYQIMLLVARA